jgi:hypothetical protein
VEEAQRFADLGLSLLVFLFGERDSEDDRGMESGDRVGGGDFSD